ncbi:MAG TPA: site-2 protease family protein [Candidatus Sulfomarinibacteraceae bacterium]|nr:site-2 protease family protein [Candidatus Sulfomarinibacteraceae bacterium]
MPFFDSPEQAIAALTVLAVLLLVAFPIHEFSHALAAYRLGDSTARLFGRLTLNPLAHFDPAGGLILALSVILSGGTFGFGWAKPTPVNPANLRGGRRGDALVALAGPVSNLALAIAAALPIRYLIATGIEPPTIVVQILISFFSINLALMIFNLIPIPPLDGSHVLYALLDPPTAWRVRAILSQYGTLVLMVAVFLPILPGGQTLIGLVFDVIGRPLASILLGT